MAGLTSGIKDATSKLKMGNMGSMFQKKGPKQ
jgi:hypothetical protein